MRPSASLTILSELTLKCQVQCKYMFLLLTIYSEVHQRRPADQCIPPPAELQPMNSSGDDVSGVRIKAVHFSRPPRGFFCWGIRRLPEDTRIPASSWLRDLRLMGSPGSF
jgi:hypothetical protein